MKKLTEMSKQILAVLYAQYMKTPNIVLKQVCFSTQDGLDIDDDDNEDLVNALKDISGSEAMLLACLKYLLESGYISCQSFSEMADYSVLFIGISLTAKGIDYSEGLIRGDAENIKQAGLIINGDVDLSPKLESLLKVSDLTGLGKLFEALSPKE